MRTIGFEWNRSNFCVGLQVDEMNCDVKAIFVVINHIREFDVNIVSRCAFVAPALASVIPGMTTGVKSARAHPL